MQRRSFITLLGGIASWPLAVRAQQAPKLPTIGFLGPNTSSTDGPRVGAFVQRLRELGWIEGQNVAIEYRWAEGRVEHLGGFAAEFVRLKVDVIVTSATPPILAAKRATSVIPIVFAAAGDPVGNGLVASLARPGGNVTGLSLQATDLAGKRLELLREVVPALHHLAIIANRDAPPAMVEMREVQTTARTLGLEVITSEIRHPEDIAPAIEAIKGRAEGLYVCLDPLVTTNRTRIISLALGVRLPTMFNVREFVEAGGLMSYGPSLLALYRRTGDFVDKILRGAKPADLPVEQPTKFDLTLNLKATSRPRTRQHRRRPPWSQYFCCMLAGNPDFVRAYPIATKRVLRAILKATDLCATEPGRAARQLIDGGRAERYDYAFQTLSENPYDKWREYDPADTIRWYALRLHEVGLIKSSPKKIIAKNTNWRFLDELKRELKA